MKKICRICGKVFDAKQSNYVGCSPECRKINYRRKLHGYVLTEEQRDKKNEYHKMYYRKNRKPTTKTCRSCGVLLPHGRMTYCIDCLLKDFKANNARQARHRLENRGYTVMDAWLEIKQRGI